MTRTIALHTRIAEGAEADYVREHAVVPPALDAEDDGIEHVWSLPASPPTEQA